MFFQNKNYRLSKIWTVLENGKESTVNRALGGSIYTGKKLGHCSLCKIFLVVMKYSNILGTGSAIWWMTEPHYLQIFDHSWRLWKWKNTLAYYGKQFYLQFWGHIRHRSWDHQTFEFFKWLPEVFKGHQAFVASYCEQTSRWSNNRVSRNSLSQTMIGCKGLPRVFISMERRGKRAR